MYRIIKKANYDLPDVIDFVQKIPADFFDKDVDIIVSRSPGRLDVMGGIADYSGSLVLEMPIAEATFVALQKRKDSIINIISSDENKNLSFTLKIEDFFQNGRLIEYSDACQYFKQKPENHWAAYIAGVFFVLINEKSVNFKNGANIFITSNIPQGKGVSSSAALEAAVISAVTAAFNIKIGAKELAILCQKVENLVVGAPCGIMDQMTVICGKSDELLSMLCQPAELTPTVKIPDKICFWGIDSGIRHAVVGADYGSVRTGAFIGYRIIADLENLSVYKSNNLEIEDPKWHGYLANLTPAEFKKNYQDKLPKKILGKEFLQKYEGITDKITKVSPEKTYPVFYPTAHPIFENARVKSFSALLNKKMDEENLTKLGELMFAAHQSYSNCGLGSAGTDLLVDLVKEQGISKGLYGAKITGGGSGGTVAVLGLKDSFEAIKEIVNQYKNHSNYQPYLFCGSSPGAADYGFLKLTTN